ncbi:MAG: ArsR/SmtB family transcription factor [Trebonia sp.]
MLEIAHPARLEIWQYIGLEGPVTATECAEVVGLSPSACSYHLRTSRIAGQWLTETVRAQVEDRHQSYLDRQQEYSPAWRKALGQQHDVLHVTPEELGALRDHLVEFLADYRRLSRDERPPDARRVQVLIDFNPWFSPEETG